MRRLVLLLSAALLPAACAHLPPLTAIDPGQAIAHDRRSATAEVGQVRVTVRPDEWRGWPEDLDDYATPVEVIVENGSQKEISIRHTLFTLLGPDGFRYDALGPAEVRRLIGNAFRTRGYWYYGAYGVYPWPGLYLPWPQYYPYLWWGDPWWGDPWFGPAPLPPRPTALPTPSGTLTPGGKVSVLVFFPIPAPRVTSCTVQAEIVASDGSPVGTLKLPFERRALQQGAGGSPP